MSSSTPDAAAVPAPPSPVEGGAAPRVEAALHGELARLADLRPHPRNYRQHPEDQLEHIAESIRQHGFYRSIVVTTDGTILAGHGLALAAAKLGRVEVPVVRLPLDPNSAQALRLLAGDNEIARRAEVDDRILSDILREIKDIDITGLLGTGYDAAMLANLVFITRPEQEIRDFDAAAHWAGMPAFEQGEQFPKLVVSFDTEEERVAFMQLIGVATVFKKYGLVWSIWWPDRPKHRLRDEAFVEAPLP